MIFHPGLQFILSKHQMKRSYIPLHLLDLLVTAVAEVEGPSDVAVRSVAVAVRSVAVAVDSYLMVVDHCRC